MKAISLFSVVFLIAMGSCLAQNTDTCECCSDSYQAFDFWVGDWTVYNTSGKVIGTNKIFKMQNACVLQENWEASNQTNTGTSYNFFDSKDRTWNQVWISNTGNILRLKGNVNPDGAMVLKSDLNQNSTGSYYNQITWSKNEDGSVTQLWQILNEKGEVIKKSFEGIYKKSR